MEKERDRSRGRKSPRSAATGRSPSPTASESSNESPGADRIRILAYEIYETRSSSGMLGDAVSDWLEAERRLAEPDALEERAAGPADDASPGPRSSRTRSRRQPGGE